MIFSIVLIAILTAVVFLYVFHLEKDESNLFLRVFLSLLFGGMSLCSYGIGVWGVICHYSNAHRVLENYMPLGGGVSIGFMWFLVIIGLFPLRQFLGAVLGREDTVWLSD